MDGAVGLQVVGEVQNALRRRLRVPSRPQLFDRRATVAGPFRHLRLRQELTSARHRPRREAGAGRLSYWDACAAGRSASAAGVRVMLSEDMADGLVFGRLEVINPFGRAGPTARARQILGL